MSTLDDIEHDKLSRLSAIREHFKQNVSQSWSDIVLIICTFIAGLVDSAVFNVWDCFVSMQTGNTVYVGLGVSGQPLSSPYRWVKSVTAIISFMIGTFVFSRFCRLLSPLRRSTVCSSFALQAALIFIAAALVGTGFVPGNASDLLPENFIVLLPLSMLSFQSGGQITMSRVLDMNDVPTVVLTSSYCDLMFDPQLFATGVTENSKRNRRVLSITALVLGAICGGYLTRSGDLGLVLWIAGGIKVGISIVWVFWKAESSVRLE